MSLRDLTLKPEATVTYAGDATTFAEDGVQISGGLHVIDITNTDFRTRMSLTAKNRQPVYDKKTLSYTKEKKTISLVKPLALSNGQTAFNTLRIEMEVHPEAASDLKTLFRSMGVGILADSDFDAFWATGALS